jgi:Glycosyl transferase family 2
VRSEIPAPAPVPLTVVIPTCHGWAAVRPFLDRLRDQAQATGAEVVVADGSTEPGPPPDALWPGLVWLRRAGVGVFTLRALGRQVARGDILAVTEDHCLVAPDWCARILEAHARHPDAAAIKGVVRNGSRDRLADRASFLLVQAPNLAPFTGRPEDAILGASCATYSRRALERLSPEAGWPLELHDAGRWRAAGETIVADERIWVEHHQSAPLLELSRLHYHNARAISGLRRSRLARRDWARLAAAPILLLARTARTVALCAQKRVPWGALLTSVPLFLWFYAWKASGEITGYLTGPGDSETRI